MEVLMNRYIALSFLVVFTATSAVAQETNMYAPQTPQAYAQPYADASIQQPYQQPRTVDTSSRSDQSFLEMVAEEQEGIAHGSRVKSSRRLMKLSGL